MAELTLYSTMHTQVGHLHWPDNTCIGQTLSGKQVLDTSPWQAAEHLAQTPSLPCMEMYALLGLTRVHWPAGYRNGKALVGVRDYLMTNFKLGTHIAVERTQRNIYPTYWDFHDKLMITPYVPNAASSGTGNTFGELSARTPGIEDRKLFAYLKARCSTRQVRRIDRLPAPIAASSAQYSLCSHRALLMRTSPYQGS